jgi:formamidopyrimidine-DNA glycosylase
MPELPEVETVRQTLRPLLIGKTIEKVDVLYQKMTLNEDFEIRIKGQMIHDIHRYGKYLIFILDDCSMISHLRMEGKYFHLKQEPIRKHEHVIFHLSDGHTLRYHDVRKFGRFELKDKVHYMEEAPLSLMGPEPKDASGFNIFKKLKSKRIPIKKALLDQHIVSGLGNIYVDETLFQARIHPLKTCHTLTKAQVNTILLSATSILDRAIVLGGTHIRTYYAPGGIDGRFQNELKVHTKKGQPCQVCHTPIIKMVVGGRGTYVCPVCQKK